MTKSKQTNLSQFLPYDPHTKINGDLRTGLKEFQSLLRALIAAVRAHNEKRYEKFDSLVGENACQIRSVWLCKNEKEATAFNHKLTFHAMQSLAQIDQQLQPAVIESLMLKDISLQQLLSTKNLDLPLTKNEAFLLRSFLLCELKTLKEEEKSSTIFRTTVATPKKMVQFGEVSPSFAKSLVSKLRQQVSQASVQFVREEAERHLNEHTMTMVSNKHTVIHNALTCIPMFWTYKTVLQTARKENIPLIIHAKFLKQDAGQYSVVDEEYVFFDVDPTGAFVKTNPNHIDHSRPACVIQGIVAPNAQGETLTKEQWHALIDQHLITDVILAGAADHRQYPNAELDANIHQLEDKEYEHYRTLALAKGFSVDNPTTFFIQHVYAVDAEQFLKSKTKVIPLRSANEPSIPVRRKQYSLAGV